MTFSLTSLQVPTPLAPGSPALGGGTAGPFATGMTAGVTHRLNQLAAQVTLLGQLGGGGYGIVTGLGLSAATGLNVAVAPGIALLDGLLELVSSSPFGSQVQVPPPYTLADNATNYVWLSATGALLSGLTLAPPTGARLFLGTVTTASGAITALDGSGVVTISGGAFSRRTADAVIPADSPPATIRLLTQTAFGTFWWDGASHKALVDLSRQMLTPSLTATLSASLALTAQSPNLLFLTASGGDQVVTLPATASLPAGWTIRIYNAGASHNVVVKDSTATTTLATLPPGETVGATTYLNSSGSTVFPTSWTPASPTAV